MTKAPNHQKLIIPGKNSQGAHAGYRDDQTAIEMWANEGIVRSLHAGSGITLDPSDGVDQGQGIEISASGGGGGAVMGYIRMIAGPDDAIWPFAQWLTASDTSVDNTSYIGPLGQFGYPTGGGAFKVSFQASWFTAVNGGQSVNFLPSFGVPAYTSASQIFAEFFFEATDVATFGNTGAGIYTCNFALPSGFAGQVPASDLSAVNPAFGDLSLVPGSGENGTGLVSAAGNLAYLASVVGNMVVPGDIVF